MLAIVLAAIHTDGFSNLILDQNFSEVSYRQSFTQQTCIRGFKPIFYLRLDAFSPVASQKPEREKHAMKSYISP